MVLFINRFGYFTKHLLHTNKDVPILFDQSIILSIHQSMYQIAHIRNCMGESGATEVIQEENRGGQEARSPHSGQEAEPVLHPGRRRRGHGVLAP